jgi:hypothetical protein
MSGAVVRTEKCQFYAEKCQFYAEKFRARSAVRAARSLCVGNAGGFGCLHWALFGDGQTAILRKRELREQHRQLCANMEEFFGKYDLFVTGAFDLEVEVSDGCAPRPTTAVHRTALGTALHCTALHCTHCTALHCTALHCSHCTARHCTALHCTHCTARHCTALHWALGTGHCTDSPPLPHRRQTAGTTAPRLPQGPRALVSASGPPSAGESDTNNSTRQ